jgi:pimeloyl-ACP methyl ester carboxylesterase
MATYATAEPQFIEVNGTRFAYLRFGSTAKTTIPVVFNQHFRGTFDHWDPELIDPIAAVREVILIDNAGVGKSGGAVTGHFAVWGDNIANVIKALGLSQVDLFGFSMGGFVAQTVALNHPHLIRKLILAGTGPSAGEGIEGGDLAVFQRLAAASTEEESRGAFVEGFYSLTPAKQALGNKWWKRFTTARQNRSDYVGPEGTKVQIDAAIRWGSRDNASEGSYDRLHEIKIPVLIGNGAKDIIVPTVNSWVMFSRLTNADAGLHLYPDTGHGFLNEYAGQFAYDINQFLDAQS